MDADPALKQTVGNQARRSSVPVAMSRRAAMALTAGLALGVLLSGCGSKNDPYDALTSETSSYVIPGSERWSSGELCLDGGSCSGAITVSEIERLHWYRLVDLAIATADPGDDVGSVPASLTVDRNRGDSEPESESLDAQVWGPDVDEIEEVLGQDLDVWIGIDPETNDVRVTAAFDEDGRVAGVGHAAADYFTAPVARFAADAAAASAFSFLEPRMAK